MMTRRKSAAAKAAASSAQAEDSNSPQRKPAADSKLLKFVKPQSEELDVNALMREKLPDAESREYLQLTRLLKVCRNQLDKPGRDPLLSEQERAYIAKVQHSLLCIVSALTVRDVVLAESVSSEG